VSVEAPVPAVIPGHGSRDRSGSGPRDRYGLLTTSDPLRALLADATVTDVFVNGPHEVWVDRGAGPVRAPLDFGSAERLRRYAQRLAGACGRRLDDASPFADACLPDGTRFHAVLPPLAVDGPCLSLRAVRSRPDTLGGLTEAGTLTPQSAALLSAVVAARLAYLVTGGTGAGKTTLLATMVGLVPAQERVVLVEDIAELRPRHPHAVTLQARTANVEGAGAVTLRDLVRQALRMRPDRLVLGECRGAEVVDLLGALNTGHEGGAATLHANAAADVPARMVALGLAAGVPAAAVGSQLTAAVQVVLHLRRSATTRVLDEVCVLDGNGARPRVEAAWSRTGGAAAASRRLARLISERDVPVPAVLRGCAS
jgi:pilus assembly protein CpaF